MNHTHRNVRLTKEKPATFETANTANTAKLRGKRERNVYITVYNKHEIIYSD